jgi:class 3 adenylate cyclase/methyl-accepting chemotaxis protein/ActR/RegA family two-component response regulator
MIRTNHGWWRINSAMQKRILILQSDPKSSKALAEYFVKRGDKVWHTLNLNQCFSFIRIEKPDLIFIDLHFTVNDLTKILSFIRREHPTAGIIVTNKHPDIRKELIVKELGAQVFLRHPFTPDWIEAAIGKLGKGNHRNASYINEREMFPRVRIPMRFKITFPYVLLALLFAIVSAFLVSRYVVESMLERFTIQLIDTGKLGADWMVQEEGRILESLRLIANTEGLSEAIQARDSEKIRSFVLPIVINSQQEAVEILDAQGLSLLSLHHRVGEGWENFNSTQGDSSMADLDFVQDVLKRQADQSGDKFAGLAQLPSGDFLYIAGPVTDGNNNLVGAVLVGISLTKLVQDVRQNTLGQVTLYGVDGVPIASTLFMQRDLQPVEPQTVLKILWRQDQESTIRDLKVASTTYSEILGPWEVRGGKDLGLIGASLAQNFLSKPTLLTRFQVFLIVMLSLIAVIIMGVFLANQITTPLSKVVQASIELARGNLEVKVPSQGNDEVSVLAHAFNYMVSGLQEGIIYRDLLGRTVSPQVREALRRSFASGNLRLEGQSSEATVLMSDIRGFTSLAEKEEPTTILNWLNEYFTNLVPVINSFGGVVDKFEGDAMLAFFGILPTPLSAQLSAHQACLAAVKLLSVIEQINIHRAERNEPPLVTGIGVNTGSLIAGGLGTSDRLNYTVIGDTVNTTQRIQGMTRMFGESGIVVSENTLIALGDKRGEFLLEPLGEHALKGKMELLWLYRLYPPNTSPGNSEQEDVKHEIVEQGT